MKRIIVGILILALAALPLVGCTAPASAPTSAEQAYIRSLSDQVTTVGEATSELGELFQNPQIGNDQWTLRVAAQLATIRVVYDEAMELAPPSSMAEININHIQAMKLLNDATYLIVQGIDELDPSLLDAAGEKILSATQLIREGTQLVEEFTETYK